MCNSGNVEFVLIVIGKSDCIWSRLCDACSVFSTLNLYQLDI